MKQTSTVGGGWKKGTNRRSMQTQKQTHETHENTNNSQAHTETNTADTSQTTHTHSHKHTHTRTHTHTRAPLPSGDAGPWPTSTYGSPTTGARPRRVAEPTPQWEFQPQ